MKLQPFKPTAVSALFCILLLFIAAPLELQSAGGNQQDAKLKLAAPIGDHMVLQHSKETSVWGTGKPGSEVVVSFGDQVARGKIDGKGKWLVKLPPSNVSSKPSTMKIAAGEDQIEVYDILVGEVWMCSGQSNMAFRLAQSEQPNFSDGDLPMVRFFTTASKTARTPQDDCDGQWQIMTPETCKGFSAVGFYFGKRLFEELEVPVGLVDTSWGGKPVEAFTSAEKMKQIRVAEPLLKEWKAKADSYDAANAKKQHEVALARWKKRTDELKAKAKESGQKVKLPRRPALQVDPLLDSNHPSAIYNQKVAPWTRYAIAGSIWYQGESNRQRAVQYQDLLAGMIVDWREQWSDDFPFYIVQLASFMKPSTEPGVADAWAELQNAQTLVSKRVPNCGIAVANDIGAANDIHPKNKKDVGIRLAMLALKQHYGKDFETFASPVFNSYTIAKDHIVVKFDHCGKGLRSRDGGPLKRFEIAGADRKWQWADAEIVGKDQVKVMSSLVNDPIAVRYAWAANPEGANLVNDLNLPASLFRTDFWPLSTAGQFTRAKRVKAKPKPPKNQAGFEPLFNGKDLTGWRNPYDHGQAFVDGNEIHLTANKKFFLVTEKEYSDFELIVEIKLPEGKANSGVMFRCHVEPNKVYGYQAECDGSDRRWSGGLYDEGRRKWIWPSRKDSDEAFKGHEQASLAHFAKPEVRDALKRNDWNRYEIRCQGNLITIKLNGIQTTSIRDGKDVRGFIGIQHHGEKGQTYKFRNLMVKELGAK